LVIPLLFSIEKQKLEIKLLIDEMKLKKDKLKIAEKEYHDLDKKRLAFMKIKSEPKLLAKYDWNAEQLMTKFLVNFQVVSKTSKEKMDIANTEIRDLLNSAILKERITQND
jgi:hypothetical protein